MIDKVFNVITSEINNYFNSKLGTSTEGRIIASNISEAGNGNAASIDNMVVMSLVNIEEDRISRPPDNYRRSGQQMTMVKPPYYLNLYILFAANFDVTNYTTALQNIAYIIQFFQFKNVFTRLNTPTLDPGLKELIFDMKTLSVQDLNNLWGVLGSKYMPSVLFKVRLITISEEFTEASVPLIKEIQIEDTN
ncbi:MAG TPA: DUF4255 domain-containing protein [Bacteroidia bacterium]|jgi:hypothetical protein|nr:DUF4255 domain-containing protein [Bacteroidia bacterium]